MISAETQALLMVSAFKVYAAVLHSNPTMRRECREYLRTHNLTDEGKAYYRQLIEVRRAR